MKKVRLFYLMIFVLLSGCNLVIPGQKGNSNIALIDAFIGHNNITGSEKVVDATRNSDNSLFLIVKDEVNEIAELVSVKINGKNIVILN